MFESKYLKSQAEHEKAATGFVRDRSLFMAGGGLVISIINQKKTS